MEALKKKMFISITPSKGTISVKWSFTTITKQENDGVMLCYIPFYDLFYSATDQKMVEMKGKAMTQSYFDNFFLHNKQTALKSISIDLRKRGFKPDRDIFVMSNFIKNKAVNAKFESGISELPFDLNESHKFQENEMTLSF